MGQIIINGLVLGASYALIALGLTLIFSIMNILNFAHGQMYMLGGFVIYYLYGQFHLPYFVALFGSMATLAIVGMIFERFLFRRVLREVKREEVTMLLAMGSALLLEHGALLAFGEKERGVPPVIEGVYKFAGAYIPAQRLFITLCSVVLIIGFLIFMRYTKPGRALRALAQDRIATYLQGVNVDRVSMMGFAIGAALAGGAGGLLALIFPVFSGAGTPISIKAFMMIMIGGAGVIGGALLGGLILGMLESIGYSLIPGSMTYLIIFSVVIILLIVRPQGIMGEQWG